MRSSLLLLAALASIARAQNTLFVTSVEADPPQLSCTSPGNKETTLTVQIGFNDNNPELRGQRISLILSIANAHPSENRIRILDSEQSAMLDVSPAVVKFRAACESATQPGQVVLFAEFKKRPKGVDVKPGLSTQTSHVTIKIDQKGTGDER